MYQNVRLTTLALTCMFAITLPVCVYASSGTTTKNAINKLGGTIRPFVQNKPGIEVDFHIHGRKLTDSGLVQLTHLDNIVSLDLRDTKITNAGLVHLKRLTQLRWLHLERTKVGDEGVAHLAGLDKLEYLNLYGTKITDKALGHLVRLKKLKRLYVWQTKITDVGVARLRKALPKLRVVRGVDLAKLPSKDTHKPSAKPSPIKWMVVGDTTPPRSKTGSNITVLFENNMKRPIKLYWISYGGERKLYATLAPGAKRRQNSYSKATWLITTTKENALGYFITTTAEINQAVIPRLE